MANANNNLVSWEAPEFRFYQKNFGWYFSFIALVALVVGYEVLAKDWFGAISLAIIAFFVGAFALQKPKSIAIAITTKGIFAGGIEVPYQSIRYFWIVNNQNHQTLNVETTAYLNKILILELMDQDPELIRESLLPFIPELPSTSETLAQRIMHRLKF